jgi:hypothetical protein
MQASRTPRCCIANFTVDKPTDFIRLKAINSATMILKCNDYRPTLRVRRHLLLFVLVTLSMVWILWRNAIWLSSISIKFDVAAAVGISKAAEQVAQGSPTNATEAPIHDSSVIILSNLIPTHPSIKMIHDTIASLHLIKGLSPTVPVYITVDGLRSDTDEPENRKRLQNYTEALHFAYKHLEHPVTVLTSQIHKHISNSIQLAVDLVDTAFVYVLRHDFRFIKEIDHVALVKSVREYPNELRMV